MVVFRLRDDPPAFEILHKNREEESGKNSANFTKLALYKLLTVMNDSISFLVSTLVFLQWLCVIDSSKESTGNIYEVSYLLSPAFFLYSKQFYPNLRCK